MENNLFNEQMSSSQAGYVFFSEIDGKSATEIEKIKAEYFAIIPRITKRELDLAAKGWLID